MLLGRLGPECGPQTGIGKEPDNTSALFKNLVLNINSNINITPTP